jgi:putative intracellular protease/amidase
VKDQNGQSIFSGRKATSFSNEEEEQVKLTDAVPFLVETRLKELGAKYEKNDKAWGPHVTVDGQRLFFLLIF